MKKENYTGSYMNHKEFKFYLRGLKVYNHFKKIVWRYVIETDKKGQVVNNQSAKNSNVNLTILKGIL